MKENKPKLQSIFCSLSAKTGLVWGSLEDLVVRLILKSNNDKLVNANTWAKVYEFVNRDQSERVPVYLRNHKCSSKIVIKNKIVDVILFLILLARIAFCRAFFEAIFLLRWLNFINDRNLFIILVLNKVGTKWVIRMCENPWPNRTLLFETPYTLLFI